MRFRLRPRGRGQSVGRSHTCGWGWRRTCACTAWWRPSSGSPSSSSGWEPSCRRWWEKAGVFFQLTKQSWLSSAICLAWRRPYHTVQRKLPMLILFFSLVYRGWKTSTHGLATATTNTGWKKERQRQCIKKVGWARFGRFRWEKKDIYTLEQQLWWILIFSLFNLSSAVAGPTDSGGEVVVVVVHADCG